MCDLAFSSAAAQLPGEMGARTCVRGDAWDCDPGVLNAAILPWDWACMNSACPTTTSEMQENPSKAPAGSKSSGRCLFHVAVFSPSRLWDAPVKQRMGSCWGQLLVHEPRSWASCPHSSEAGWVTGAAVVPHGLAVRIPGFHPGSPGSTPGVGK